MDKEQKIIFFIDLIIVCLLAFYFGSALGSPFFGNLNFLDEGQFGSWAYSMMHGKLMFKDMYIVYGPLYVYPLYILFKLFNPSVFLIRAYLEFGSILGIIVINFLMLDLKLPRFARWIMNIFLITLPIMLLRQAMVWIFLYVLMRQKKPLIWDPIVLGILNILTFLISPDMGILTSAISLLFYLYRLYISQQKNIVLKHFFIFLGTTIVTFFLFFLWSHTEGWFGAYITNTKSVLTDFSGMNVPNGKNLLVPISLSLKGIIAKEVLPYWLLIFYTIVSIYLTIRLILKKKSKNEFKIFFILIIGIAYYYLLISRPDHFFFFLSPALLLGIILGNELFKLIKTSKQVSSKIILSIYLSLLCVFGLRLVYINYPYIMKASAELPQLLQPRDNPQFVGPIDISKDQKQYITTLQKYMNQTTSPHDTIFILNDMPLLYMLLNRQNSTSYVLPYAANTKSLRKKLLSELKNNQQKEILIDPHGWAVDGVPTSVRLPEIMKYIQHNYVLFATVEGVQIYQPK